MFSFVLLSQLPLFINFVMFSFIISLSVFSLPFLIPNSCQFVTFSQSNALFCFAIPFIIHYLSFLATLSPHPYTLLHRPLKCFIQPIIAYLISFPFVLLSFAFLFQLSHLIYNATRFSWFARLV